MKRHDRGWRVCAHRRPAKIFLVVCLRFRRVGQQSLRALRL